MTPTHLQVAGCAPTFPHEGYDELIVASAIPKTITSALHGLVRDDARTRHEVLALTTRVPQDH